MIGLLLLGVKVVDLLALLLLAGEFLSAGLAVCLLRSV